MLDGLDVILIGVGLAGMLLAIITMLKKGAAIELLPITVGSLGVVLVGLGGLVAALWLMIIGGLLLTGAFIYERRQATLPQSPLPPPED